MIRAPTSPRITSTMTMSRRTSPRTATTSRGTLTTSRKTSPAARKPSVSSRRATPSTSPRTPTTTQIGGPVRCLVALVLAVAVLTSARVGSQRSQPDSQRPSIVVLYSQASQRSPRTDSQNLVSDVAQLRNPKLDAEIALRSAPPAPPAQPAPPQDPVAAAALAAGSVRTDGDVLHRGRAPKPRCAGEQPFCLYDLDYPVERVHDILNTYHEDANTLYHALHRYNPQELINRDNLTHNYRHRGHFACESEVAYLRPGWARNWKDEWVTVVNTDKFPQMVRVETCKFLGQKCEFLAPCYKSSCVQRYAATRLLCVDPANPHQRPTIDVFEMPVACSCFVENFRFI